MRKTTIIAAITMWIVGTDAARIQTTLQEQAQKDVILEKIQGTWKDDDFGPYCEVSHILGTAIHVSPSHNYFPFSKSGMC